MIDRSRAGGSPRAVDPEVAALVDAARAADQGGRREEARSLYQAALDRLGHHRAPSLACSLLLEIGRSFLEEDNSDAAEAWFSASLSLAETIEDLRATARAVTYKALVRHARGRLDEAEQLYLWAERRAEVAGEGELSETIRRNLARLARTRRDLRDSLDLELAGQTQPTASPEPIAEQDDPILDEINQAWMHIARGDLAQARESCDRAYQMSREAGQERWLGHVFKQYGILYRKANETDRAVESLLQAERIAEERKDLELATDTAAQLGSVYRSCREYAKALHQLQRAHRLLSSRQPHASGADVSKRIDALEDYLLRTAREWGESVESRERHTEGHCARVADHACLLAEADGLDRSALVWLRIGALLHDIGKSVVPSHVLDKVGTLTVMETEALQRHPVQGVELLGELVLPWDIRPMIRHHHELWDGSGYPDGLFGDRIPRAARILAVADAFDALTTDRAHRAGLPPEAALEVLVAKSGRAFDPELVSLYGEVMHGRRGIAVRQPPPSEALRAY